MTTQYEDKHFKNKLTQPFISRQLYKNLVIPINNV